MSSLRPHRPKKNIHPVPSLDLLGPWPGGRQVHPAPDPAYTSPLFALCRLFGVLPTRLCGRTPSVLYPCLLQLPLACFLVLAKAMEIVSRYNGSTDTTVHSIMLALYTCLGLPDVVVALLHINKIRTEGKELETRFTKFKLTVYPTMYSKYLTLLGVVFYPVFLLTILLVFHLDATVTIFSIIFNQISYLILMLFCSYLQLLKVEMSELLPLTASTASEAILCEVRYLKKARWVGEVFSHQLLVFSVRVLINIIIKTYHLLYSVSVYRDVYKALIITFSICWEFYLLGAMTRSCNDVLKQVETFNRELFKVIRQNTELYYHEKVATYVNRRPRLFFSACGLFNIGYPLVTSIIAASLSYIVILLQFST